MSARPRVVRCEFKAGNSARRQNHSNMTTTAQTPPSTASANGIRLVQPYLFFNGRTEEALAFYRETLGAEITMLMRFKDSPEKCDNGGPQPQPDKVMHASFRIGATELFASDGCTDAPLKFEGFSLSLTPGTVADAERLFAALAAGGTVQMPISRTFFSPAFGMVADRFGLSWMIYVAPAS